MQAGGEHGAVNALCGSTTSVSSTPEPTQAAAAGACEAFEAAARATASMQNLLITAPEGLLSAEDRASIRSAIRCMTFAPRDVDAEVHEQHPVIAAIPTIVVCGRCEREGHARPQCKNTCAACGFAWPECHENCPMRYDVAAELLMAASEHTCPSVLTTDLDNEEYAELPVAQAMVNAATEAHSSGRVDPMLIPDAEVVARYVDELRERFVRRFPSIDDMTPAQWMTLLDAGQLARLCRAVAGVVLTMEKLTVRGTARDGLVRWDPEARDEIHAQHCSLRDVVSAVISEIRELLTTVWHQDE